MLTERVNIFEVNRGETFSSFSLTCEKAVFHCSNYTTEITRDTKNVWKHSHFARKSFLHNFLSKCFVSTVHCLPYSGSFATTFISLAPNPLKLEKQLVECFISAPAQTEKNAKKLRCFLFKTRGNQGVKFHALIFPLFWKKRSQVFATFFCLGGR